MKKMKRIFILLVILVYIYCSLESCEEEKDPSQCQKHSIELSDISCYLFEERNNKYCNIYADNTNLQKTLKKYTIGLLKESLSIQKDYDEVFDFDQYIDNETFYVPEKDTYNRSDTIKMKEVRAKDLITSNDIEIIKNGNTCYNRYFQNLINLSIKNKTICFGVDRFEENKNLMDCGHVNVTISYNNKDYLFHNCFFSPDANADPKFTQFYNEYYNTRFVVNLKNEVEQEFMEEVGQYLKVSNLKKRKLQNPIDYDFKMTVEDRYGNIISYDKNGKIIDEPKKFLYSSNYFLNIFLFLLNLLLIL